MNTTFLTLAVTQDDNQKPTADQPLVTHEDLQAIEVLERKCADLNYHGRGADLLRRLRRAAEADKPALPEG